jgi:hypothetical protein
MADKDAIIFVDKDVAAVDQFKSRFPALYICPKGHVTFFLSCDPSMNCLTESYVYECETEPGNRVPMFTCDKETVTIPFTLVCDHHDDCGDGSDEYRCMFQRCHGFACTNRQCIDVQQLCDGQQDCVTGEDEENCPLTRKSNPPASLDRVCNASIITLLGDGTYTISSTGTLLVNDTDNQQVSQLARYRIYTR